MTKTSSIQNQVFPFGEPLKVLTQQDRIPKKVFVLGVYASAVHAKWFSPEGKLLCQALAVASEPCIFWTGEGATEIVVRISIPPEAGYLKPADEKLNGSSGRALDELYLSPLRYSRNNAWLCDLVPYSCQNADQTRAIMRAYNPIKATFRLPDVTILSVSAILADESRRNEILQELAESQATTIILLGDAPIKWFLSHVSDCKKKRLADFGKDTYGTAIKATIMDKEYSILPLVHPRQATGLGPNSKEWQDIHSYWLRKLTEK
jgi:hypothetical protein